MQSASLVHVVAQADALPQFLYGLHDVDAPVWQLPVPLQTWPVTTPPVQVVVPQVVPEGQSRQLPLPLHMPSAPQLEEGVAVHSTSGSVPTCTGAQVPVACPVFALVQATQVPPHGPSQQTSSTHCPVAHSAPREQLRPSSLSATQLDPLQ